MGWLENTFGTVGPSAGTGTTLTPEQQSAQWERARNTPMGQAAQRATDATNKLNRDKELAAIQAKRDEIAVSQGTAAANKWYQEQQIKMIEDDHLYNRQKLAVDSTLKAAEIGSQLKGPRNYPFYLEAANQVAGSGIGSTLLANQPGGLGPMQQGFNTQRQTIGSVLGDFGFGGGGAGQQGGGVSNSQLGLTDQDAQQLQSYIRDPNAAPTGFWESKSGEQKDYLRGLMEFWGHSPDTFEQRYADTRPRQGNALAATAGGYY